MITFLNRNANLNWNLKCSKMFLEFINYLPTQNVKHNQTSKFCRLIDDNQDNIKNHLSHLLNIECYQMEKLKSFTNIHVKQFTKPLLKSSVSSLNLFHALSFCFSYQKQDKKQFRTELQQKVYFAIKNKVHKQEKNQIFQAILKQYSGRNSKCSIKSLWDGYLSLVIKLYIEQDTPKIDFFYQNNSQFKSMVDTFLKKLKQPEISSILKTVMYKQIKRYTQKYHQNKIVNILTKQLQHMTFKDIHKANITTILNILIGLSYQFEMTQNLKKKYLEVYKQLQNILKFKKYSKEIMVLKFVPNQEKQKFNTKVQNNIKITCKECSFKIYYQVYKFLKIVQQKVKINSDLFFAFLCKPFQSLERQQNVSRFSLIQLKTIFNSMYVYLKQNQNQSHQEINFILKQILKNDNFQDLFFQFDCNFISYVNCIFKQVQIKKSSQKNDIKTLKQFLPKIQAYVLRFFQTKIQNYHFTSIIKYISRINVFLYIMSFESKIYNIHLYQKIFELLTKEHIFEFYSQINILNIIYYGLVKLRRQDRKKLQNYQKILWNQYWKLYFKKKSSQQQSQSSTQNQSLYKNIKQSKKNFQIYKLLQQDESKPSFNSVKKVDYQQNSDKTMVKEMFQKIILTSLKKHQILIQFPKDINITNITDLIEKQELKEEIRELIKTQQGVNKAGEDTSTIQSKKMELSQFKASQDNFNQFKEFYNKNQQFPDKQKRQQIVQQEQSDKSTQNQTIKRLFTKVRKNKSANTNNQIKNSQSKLKRRTNLDKIEEQQTSKKALFNKKRRQIYEELVQEQLRYQQKLENQGKKYNFYG